MSKKLPLLVTLLAVFAMANVASAQVPQSDCLMGVFADVEGTINVIEPTQGVPFDIHVIMQLEGAVTAAAYQLFVPKLNEDIFIMGESFGIAGKGFNIDTDGGLNVALGECVVGFGGFPIPVSSHTLLIPFETTGGRTISIGPNTTWDDHAPIYTVCTFEIYKCTINSNLLLTSPIAVEETSFGAVKNLFRQ